MHTARWHPFAVTVPLTHVPALRAGVNEPVSDTVAPAANSMTLASLAFSCPPTVRLVRAVSRFVLWASPVMSNAAPTGTVTLQPWSTTRLPPANAAFVRWPFALMSP